MAEFKKKIAPRFPALSTIGVLGCVFVALALKARTYTTFWLVMAKD